MDIMDILNATFMGLRDSIRGMIAVFSMDREINEKKSARQSPTRINSLRQKPLGNGEKPPRRQLKKEEESKVMKRILQCGLLNGGIFLLSILVFEYCLLPGMNKLFVIIFGHSSFMGKLVWSWIEPILSFIFQTVWVIPLFLLSKVVNALWFQDIADQAYRHSRGRPLYSQRLSIIFADSIFSMVIQLLFLLQAVAVSYIPIQMVGTTLSFVQMCLLYSLYAFEYKWFNMGWELHTRLSFVEMHWPYFIGFGAPMAFFTQLPQSWVVSACIFSILFPFFIISGNEAAEPAKKPASIIFRFFAPVVCISNFIFSKTIGTARKVAKPETAAQHRS